MKIVSIYGSASLQRAPRPQLRAYGVPSRGFFDPFIPPLLNQFLRKSEGSELVEIASASIELIAEESLMMAWAGAEYTVKINGKPIQPWERKRIEPDDCVSIQPSKRGIRAWIGFSAAIDEKRSQIKKNDASGQILFSPGDTIRFLIAESKMSEWRFAGPKVELGEELRFVLYDDVSEIFQVQMRALQDFQFTIGVQSNRAGIRLQESIGGHSIELPSEPCIPGAIQLPPNGCPIIIGPDGPTTGGYPKIGFVIEADFPILGQFGPGDRIQLREVSLEKALELKTQSQVRMREWSEALGTASKVVEAR